MNTRLTYLYQQYIDNTCTAAEREEFLSMIAQKQEDRTITELLDGTWNTMNTTEELIFPAANSVLENILTHHKKPVVRKTYWYRYAAIAAAILVVVSAGIYFGIKTKYNSKSKDANYTVDIPAGKNKATLTLANGAVINLDSVTDGEIAQQAGIAINKTADGQLVYNITAKAEKDATASEAYNTIATPRGGQYQVNLPDGTKIWLNAASSLKYPAVFGKDERKVELIGEAYFEVAKVTIEEQGIKSKEQGSRNKDKRVPFIVVTDKQKIEVLGTHFNVNSYPDENNTKTTLLEGSVRVNTTVTQEQDNVILKPGQQSLLKNNRLTAYAVDIDEAVAWKNGYFQFNESDLGTIMRQLSRWYNVDVVFEGRSPEDLFHFKIPRNLSLTDVLKIFEINGINLKIEGRTLIVKS
ncbi:MAG: FecR domain-containing protein [Candidatus Pedobacter colombiensis]|uniref:FecR domain-containing protein n=1 Tax=Candidatus Pedobacter colombiensis TaxID=3121371 RepID=A0AAJ5W9U8_9SPHI|nr:FecR family protein [Pedobacter sp.]WEK19933.1 MAG: FecR domain-containing protein [Pedobacter sp.]